MRSIGLLKKDTVLDTVIEGMSCNINILGPIYYVSKAGIIRLLGPGPVTDVRSRRTAGGIWLLERAERNLPQWS